MLEKTYNLKVELIMNYVLELLFVRIFIKNIDVTNISSTSLIVNQTSVKQKPSICVVCTARNVKQPHSHRKSLNYPFYQQYCSIYLKLRKVTNIHNEDTSPNNEANLLAKTVSINLMETT